MSPKAKAQKPVKKIRATGKASAGFTDDEQTAMKARAKELKAEARANKNQADGERDVLAAIAAMSEPDRSMAKRLHAIVKTTAPARSPQTWYGMPAYAKNGDVICFFQSGHKLKTRYATIGFSDKAHLDEGTLWPVALALKQLTAVDEVRIAALVKQAVS